MAHNMFTAQFGHSGFPESTNANTLVQESECECDMYGVFDVSACL